MAEKPKPKPKPKAKSAVPPVAPKPDYGARGKPYKPPSARKSFKEALNINTSPSTPIGRLIKFAKGDYTRGK